MDGTGQEISSEKDLVFPPGIDTSMVIWEAMNQDGDPSQAPTMEPPRKRHSNYTYGHLCSRLLNSLQSKGRVFAGHEFFYGDIDKAWWVLLFNILLILVKP